MNSSVFQWIFVVLAALSAFTLPPARSSVRELVQMSFVPVAWPVHGAGLWVMNRLAPRHEQDMLSPTNPRTVDELRRQNSALIAQVANLQAELEDLSRYSAQYRSLQGNLRKMVEPASVYSVAGPGEAQTMTIATTGLSVKEKMAVIHPLGFAGQIIAVSAGGGTARVLLVTDRSSHVSARFVRLVPDDKGQIKPQPLKIQQPMVEGDGKGGLVVRLLPASEVRGKLKVGDVAELDDRDFPPALQGLLLGTIRKITLPQTDAKTASVELDPTATFSTLREVLVVDK